jgi:uncharacterized protein with HEPN domain
MVRDQILFIEDILEAIERIEEYTPNMDFESFASDKKTVDAVIRNLEVMGEAAKGISDDFKIDNPEINWKGIAGMRDKLIHGYFSVDPEIVWETIQKRLPELKDQLNKIEK